MLAGRSFSSMSVSASSLDQRDKRDTAEYAAFFICTHEAVVYVGERTIGGRRCETTMTARGAARPSTILRFATTGTLRIARVTPVITLGLCDKVGRKET